MLVRLLYASRPAASVNADAVASILKRSKEHNTATGITGVLCVCFNAGIFMQVLEGGRAAVNAAYNRIAQDLRHSEVTLLSYAEIGERNFASWSMGQVQMNRLNPALLLKYSDRAVLDPYAVSGKASLALFNELVATASVGAPP
ncbi:MAG: BLUF domain-containing protein [Pseudomonadota bacterium]|nr:BLUF domain-containing protein [Pseudomonadota bacterium]